MNGLPSQRGATKTPARRHPLAKDQERFAPRPRQGLPLFWLTRSGGTVPVTEELEPVCFDGGSGGLQPRAPREPRQKRRNRHFTDPSKMRAYTNSPKKSRCFVRQNLQEGLTFWLFRGTIAIPTSKRRHRKMYTKDKSNRITLRLNDEQFEFVKSQADLLGVSPSEFLRMVVNASLATSKGLVKRIKIEEGTGRENDEADINDSV